MILSDAEALYSYGGGSGPIHYAGFQCSGTETHLVNCAVATNASLVQEINCVHDEDAGVRCTNGKQFSYFNATSKYLFVRFL